MSNRSQFINGVAWTFIALGVLAVICTAPLSFVMWFMLDEVAFEAALDEAIRISPVAVPSWMTWTFANLKWILTAGLALSVASTIVAVGLLCRWRWAHAGFVVMMMLGALVHLVWAVAPFLSTPLPSGPMLMMTMVSSLFALAFGGVYAWLALVMMSSANRVEFA